MSKAQESKCNIYIKKKILITQPEVTELAPISSVAHVNVVVEGAVENRKVASLKQINWLI